MIPPVVTLEAAVVRKEWVFPFLTLDVVRAFYDMMGFNPDARAHLQGVLRDATLTTRKEIVENLTQGGPPPTMASFCHHVQAGLGPATTDHLAWWVRHIFDNGSRSHIPLGDWIYVLRQCARDGEIGWRRLHLPAAISAEAFSRFQEADNFKGYRKRAAVVEEQPMSDWDLHMYAGQLFSFDENWQEGSGFNPFGRVRGSVGAFQGFQFWAWLLRVLTPEQQVRLRDAALAIAKADELTSVKDLVLPAELDIGL